MAGRALLVLSAKLDGREEGATVCRCDTCSQQYDSLTLRDWLAGEAAYTCPGCLHGRVRAPGPAGEQGVHKEVVTGQHPEGAGGG